jgi:hypothetical protein
MVISLLVGDGSRLYNKFQLFPKGMNRLAIQVIPEFFEIRHKS